MTKNILLIGSGNEDIACIKDYFELGVIHVKHVDSVEEAIWKMNFESYCLTILELSGLNDTDFQEISKIRKQSSIPILVLLKNHDVSKRILALKMGADDVLVKPFIMEEYFVRIESLLRRYTELNHMKQEENFLLCYEKLMLDTGRRIVSIDGREILLPCKEYGILLYLLQNRRRILTFEQIYEEVWKEQYFGDKSIIFYHIGNLRRLIGKEWIKNVPGVGYCLNNK